MNNEYGLYVSFEPFDVTFGDGQTEIPNTYRKLPLSLTLLVAPILGAAFVMLFPFVVLTTPVILGISYLKERAYIVRAYEPAMSYLTKPTEAEQGVNPELVELGEEVNGRAETEKAGKRSELSTET